MNLDTILYTSQFLPMRDCMSLAATCKDVYEASKYMYNDKLVEISCGDPLRINRALDQIAQLSKQLRRCKLVDIPNNSQEVSISTSVRIEDLTYKETRTINIVGNGIFYPDRAELPCSSSLAKKLIGTKVNETKKVTSQERTIEYRILAISPYNPQE